MLNHRIIRKLFWGLAGLAMGMTAMAGETLEYSGRIVAQRTSTLLPMGNGTGVMNIQVSGTAAMSGDPPSMFLVQCAGLGLVDTEGKASSDVYCTFAETDTDAFDIKGEVVEGEGNLEVIGGSGRFAGATGSGKFQRTSTAGDDRTGLIKVKINTR